MSAKIEIDGNIPAGNIIADEVAGDCAKVHQDLRDTEGDWFYWKFRVRQANGRRLTVQFTQSAVVGTRGPAVSLDQGLTWQWLGAANVKDNRAFWYEAPALASEVWFCFCIPYLASDLRRWLASSSYSAPQQNTRRLRLSLDTLCYSRQGRKVEMLFAPAARSRASVFITCRHHCCESMANYALEGFLEAVLADDELGRWYESQIDVYAVPFVDKDGVENGDQGKNRRPRDHGRDYRDDSIYPETAAIRTLISSRLNQQPLMALDLHCPWIRGDHNECIYQVGKEKEEIWRQQQRLGAILEEVRRGPIPYRAADDLPFGVAWNTSSNYHSGRGFTSWIADFSRMSCLATAFEIPYANQRELTLTPQMARAFGADLAMALQRYFLAL